MPSRSEMLIIAGPLGQIMPRVFLVMMSAAALLIAAAYAGRAMRNRRLLQSVLAWYLGCTAGVLVYLGLHSLMAYGSPASHHPATFIEPLSLRGAALMFCQHAAVCIACLSASPMFALLTRRSRNGADVSAEQVLLETRRS